MSGGGRQSRAEAAREDFGGIIEVLYTSVSHKLELTGKAGILIRAVEACGLLPKVDVNEHIRLARKDKNQTHETDLFKVWIRKDKFVTLAVKTRDELLTHEVSEALFCRGWQHLGYSSHSGIFRDRWGWQPPIMDDSQMRRLISHKH